MKNEKIVLIFIKLSIIIILVLFYLEYSSYKEKEYYYWIYKNEVLKNKELINENNILKDELENIKIDVKDLEDELNSKKK